MTVKEIKLTELKEYENNPRINDKAVEAVANSIKNFGFKVPIIVDKENVIVAGHTRKRAAYMLGLETAPCIVADDLTPEQIKAFRVADNKTAELADWDFDKLETELEQLADIDFDMSQFGFDLSEFQNEQVDIAEDEIPEVDEETEPTTKLGDIYRLGNHFLMCGDSTKKQDVNKLLTGGVDEAETVKVDLLITDPPYNVAYEGKTDDALTIENDSMSNDDFREFLLLAFNAADSVMKEGAAFYIWHADSEGYNFRRACFDNGWQVRQCLIWNKNCMVMGRQDYQWKHEPCLYGWKSGAAHSWYNDRSQTTVMDFKKPSRNGEHPTMKPVELFAYQINNSSKEHDVVLDIFGGSGTTLIACEQLNRSCYTMELDPRYCDVIIKRWENLTGEKATLIKKKRGNKNV